MKLLVKYAYESREIRYPAGAIIEVGEAEARFLQHDAPGCFEVVQDEPVAVAFDQPPADKMVKRARRK